MVREGRDDIIKLLVDSGYNINYVGDNQISTLHMAILYKCTSIIKLLIECGVNFEQKNKDGQTPLFFAIIMRNISAAKLLINAGANLDFIDEYGNSLLSMTKKFCDKEEFGFIKARYNKKYGLLVSTMNNMADLLKKTHHLVFFIAFYLVGRFGESSAVLWVFGAISLVFMLGYFSYGFLWGASDLKKLRTAIKSNNLYDVQLYLKYGFSPVSWKKLEPRRNIHDFAKFHCASENIVRLLSDKQNEYDLECRR